MKASVVLACIAVMGSLVAAENIGQARGAEPSPMPSDKAKATFDDVRVKTFMTTVKSPGLGGTCNLPEPAKTQATMIPPPPPPPGAPPVPPDFMSYKYRIEIPCAGNNGLAAVSIEAEFVAMQSAPLNLTLALVYRK